MRNGDLIEIIDAKFQGLRAEIKANADVQDMIYQEIKKQNGRVSELEKDEIHKAKDHVRYDLYIKLSIPAAIVLFIVLFIIAETTGLLNILINIF